MRHQSTTAVVSRRSFMGLIALASPLALSGCTIPFIGEVGTSSTSSSGGLTKKAAQVSSPTIMTDGTLTVGLLSSSSAPMSYVGDNGFAGLDVDIAAAVADQLGLSVTFEQVSDVAAGLESCDIVMSATIGAADGMTLAGTYAEKANALFHKGERGVATLEELNGATVSLQWGSIYDEALSASGLPVQEVPCSSITEAFQYLEENKSEYCLCDVYTGAYVAAKIDSSMNVDGLLSAPSAVGIGVSASNAELASAVGGALTSVQSGGQLDLIKQLWVGQLPTLTDADVIVNTGGGEAEATEETGGEATEEASEE